jgi:toxin ParE1/3/4
MAEAPKELVWAPKSKRDLVDIWKYYAKVASPELANTMLRELDRAAMRLARHPLSGRSRDEIVPGLRSLLVHPHSIIYHVTESAIEIARILHERRDFSAALANDDKP